MIVHSTQASVIIDIMIMTINLTWTNPSSASNILTVSGNTFDESWQMVITTTVLRYIYLKWTIHLEQINN